LHVKNVITKLKHEQSGSEHNLKKVIILKGKIRHKNVSLISQYLVITQTFTGYPNASFKGQPGRLETNSVPFCKQELDKKKASKHILFLGNVYLCSNTCRRLKQKNHNIPFSVSAGSLQMRFHIW
jgi:YHS domain-containing protein